MEFVLLPLAAILFFWYVYRILTKDSNYWKLRKIPGPDPSFIFGNIKDLAFFKLTQAECLQSIYRAFPGAKYVGMFQMSTPTLLLRESSVIRQFLVKDFNYFTDRGFVYDEKKEPLTAHLISLEGAKWRNLRQKLTPSFSSGKIKRMTSLLHECSSRLVAYLQETCVDGEAEIEMRELTAKFTTDVIGSCAFGLQFNSMREESSEFRRMGDAVLRPSKWTTFARLVRVFFPKLFKLLNLRTFPKEVNEFFLKVVSDTLKHRRERGVVREDFLQLLLEIKKSNESPETDQDMTELTDSLIAAQAFVFFLAGFETSATTLSFCMHELAANKHVQDKIFEEIERAREKHASPLGYEAMKDMVYLEQCLMETMRKYPPVQALARVCTKEYVIPDCDVKLDVGTGILVPVYAIHHDPLYYPDPESFDPSRFSDNQIKAGSMYMPFGDGPRICIGMRFALLEMKLALSAFLSEYRVNLCARSIHPLKLDPTSFILAPKNGIWLKVSKRKGETSS